MKVEDKKAKWFEHFMAPMLVGVIVLLGQSVLQPWVTNKTNATTQRWNAKQVAFADALAIVDKQLAANPFNIGPDVPAGRFRHEESPEPSEINAAYNKLILVANNRAIIDAFIGCFGAREGQTGVWHEERVKLWQLMRVELGFEEINIKPSDVRFWVRKVESADAPSSGTP